MSSQLRYKGYVGMVNINTEEGLLYGEVVNIHDVVTFQGTTVEELKQAFVDSVEDYLNFCKEQGEKPEKPFSGRLILRMPPKTHQEVYLKARQAGISLNEWIVQGLETLLERNDENDHRKA